MPSLKIAVPEGIRWKLHYGSEQSKDIYLEEEPIDTEKRHRAYLQGRKELIEHDAIIDKKFHEAYTKQREDLTTRILAEARVVYCTCTSLRNRAPPTIAQQLAASSTHKFRSTRSGITTPA